MIVIGYIVSKILKYSLVMRQYENVKENENISKNRIEDSEFKRVDTNNQNNLISSDTNK